MVSNFRDPGSGLSHLMGAILAIIGLVVMLITVIPEGNIWQIISFSVFGVSLILLYTTSAIYHISNGSKEIIARLRRLDHSMIFVLIAGTYTPICLTLLRGKIGYLLLTLIWALALVGIVLQTILIRVPRFVYTLIYIVMGWLVVLAFSPLVEASSLKAIRWLILGGVFYSLGALIYARKKPNFIKDWLGFHEIFHIFVILGSLSHFIFIFKYCR